MEIPPIGETHRAATLAEDLIAIDCQDVCLPTASGPSTTTCITAPSSRVKLYTHVCYIYDVLAISKKPYLSDCHNKCDLDFHLSRGILPASQSSPYKPVVPGTPSPPEP